MGVIITAAPGGTMTIPVSFVFWGSVIVYAFHILEESVLGDVFVEKVRRLYWDAYDWKKFAGFNTILMSLNILAAALFDAFGGAWIIFPLSLFIERILNGFYHLFETFQTKKFSSGLLTGVVLWVLGYFTVRYAVIPGEIAAAYLIPAAVIGVVLAFLVTCFFFITPLREKIISKIRK
jgi:hypothetical protein